MAKITVANEKKEIEVAPGANLRNELRGNGVEVYVGMSKFLNCHGLGMCGECRVLVKKGMENLSRKGLVEKFTLFRMLSSIGHEDEMRLSCRCQVNGDVTVEVCPPKNWSGDNFWQKPYPNK
jgi:ferredoxin